MEKQLILTALTDLWEKDLDPIFAGKWCIRKSNMALCQELFGGNLSSKVTPDDGSFMDWEKVLPEMEELKGKWMPFLCELMNSIYGEEHGQTYWKNLLEGWFQDWYYNWRVSYEQMKRALLLADQSMPEEAQTDKGNTIVAQGYSIPISRIPASPTELKSWGIPEESRYDYFFLMYFQTVLDYLLEKQGTAARDSASSQIHFSTGEELKSYLESRLKPLPTEIMDALKAAGVLQEELADPCKKVSNPVATAKGKVLKNIEAKKLLKNVKFGLYNMLSKNAPVVANGLKLESGSAFMKNTLGKVWYLESVAANTINSYDINVRLQMSDLVRFCSIGNQRIPVESGFEEFLASRIAFDLPVCLVEDYGNQLACLQPYLNRKTPKWAILTHGASTSGILAAHWQEQGTKIIGRQDSVTPSLVNLPWASHIGLYDLYYNWGNSYPNGMLSPTDRYEPRPEKYLRKIDSPSGSFEPKGILWCTSGAERRYPDFDGWLDAGFHKNDLDSRMAVLEKFATGLSEKTAKQVSCRLRDPYGMCIHEYVEEWNPYITFDGKQVGEAVPQWSGGSLSDRIYQSQMVVVNMFLSSVLFETILRDVPIIIVAPEHTAYQNDFYRPELLSVMEELKRANVWFTDGKKAAEFLNQMFAEDADAIDVWWQEKDRHKLVMRFAQMVYETSNDRTSWWSQELLRLAEMK